MTAKDTKATGGGSSAGGGAASKSPPAESGKKKKAPKIEAVFLKRHTLAGPDYPGGCHTFLPEREENYRKQRGGPLLKRTIPADRHRFKPADFKHLEKLGIVAKAATAGGDA